MSRSHVLWGLILVVAAAAAGWFGRDLVAHRTMPDASHAAAEADGLCPGGAAPLYWRAPMDPTFVRNEPGKSPMGMDLIPHCPSAGSAAERPSGGVVIDATTVQNIGVRTVPVERRDLSRSVRAVGRVAYDERRVAHVHTKVQGWVEKLFVDFAGQEVQRGAPLLEIYSPELVATQEELLLAARYRDATGESPFDEVRGGGEALLAATKRRLALWDVRQRDIDRLLETGEVKRTLTLYAPAAGVITALGVRSGMEVQPNSNLYTISDVSRVWVLADIYEYELSWIEVGQQAEVELNYAPGQSRMGTVTYIAPFLDPKTRTAEIRIELDNADGQLKPGMIGNAAIAGAARRDALSIPSSAVIRSGRRSVAVVALGEGRFEPRDVELGIDDGRGAVEVRAGLREGEQVVVSSQFLIDSESNLQEAVQKLLGARTAHPPEAATRDVAPASEPRDAGAPAHDHSMMGRE